jgi:hypothetical protein
VRHDNVVPFDLARRGGLARRGAPDKTGEPAGVSLVMECPACASESLLDASWVEGLDVVLCARCDGEIPLVSLRQERGAG